MTETFTQVQGRRVVASDTAESIGSVKGFVLDVRGRRIEAIHVGGHGKRATSSIGRRWRRSGLTP